MANFAYIRQKGRYGSTTPILNASHLLGNEPFIYTFADDLFVGKTNRYSQMIELYEEFKGPILPCITVEDDADFKRYGIVAGDELREGVLKASSIIEKPGKEAAPSRLASVGGYLLTPEVLEYARNAQDSVPDGDEFYLTTYVLQKMMDEGKSIYGCALEHDNYYDTGNTLGYLKTVIDVALKDPSLSEELKKYIHTLL